MKAKGQRERSIHLGPLKSNGVSCHPKWSKERKEQKMFHHRAYLSRFTYYGLKLTRR